MKSKNDNLSGKANTSGERFVRPEDSSLVNTIIADAYLKGVSDIYFEALASQDITRVYFRMESVTRQYMTIPYTADDVIKKIKVMANLDIDDIRLPKIGRFIFKHEGLPEFYIMATLRPNDGQREIATLRIQTT